MKRVVLTGIQGKVAQALKRQLSGEYDIAGVSIVRMDAVRAALRPTTWQEQLKAYWHRVLDQLTAAFRGSDAIAHLGWNTRGENCGGGLDPLNVLVTDCVCRAAIRENRGRGPVACCLTNGSGECTFAGRSAVPQTEEDEPEGG